MSKSSPVPKDKTNTSENFRKANNYMSMMSGFADRKTVRKIKRKKKIEENRPNNHCRWCDFVAKNKVGRLAHERAKHPKKYKNNKD